jgi:predicted glutamine amidotransferase
MCRITAFISSKPAKGGSLFSGGEKSLLAQAGAAAGRFQDDGWGTAFARGGKFHLTRSPGPARLESAAFSGAASEASRVGLAHLREASNPAGLPRRRLVSAANTQPFCRGALAFAHNGTLFIKDEIKSLLGKYEAEVKGDNDSEVLFWQVVKMLDAYGTPQMALEMALDEIRTVWISCKDKHPGRKAPYLGLNMFLASDDSLTVLCHAPRRTRKDALLTPGWEFGRVAWRKEPGRVVFSSEPADSGPWKKMNDPEIAHATIRGGKIELAFKRIKL